MNFYDLYTDALEKVATRYRIPEGQEGKLFVRDRGQRVDVAAHRGSGITRRIQRVAADATRRLPRSNTAQLRGLLRNDRGQGSTSIPSWAGGTVVRQKYLPKEQQSPRFPKGRVVLNNDELRRQSVGRRLNRMRARKGKKPVQVNRVTRRQMLAHEAFHLNAPKGIRSSETLAHAYGGYKGTKGGVLSKARAALGQVAHYKASRGLIPVGARIAAASMGLKDGSTRRRMRKLTDSSLRGSKSMTTKLVQRARIAAKKRARARRNRR